MVFARYDHPQRDLPGGSVRFNIGDEVADCLKEWWIDREPLSRGPQKVGLVSGNKGIDSMKEGRRELAGKPELLLLPLIPPEDDLVSSR
jgi:hypothetical protein